MERSGQWRLLWIAILLICWQLPAYGINRLNIGIGEWFNQQLHGQRLNVEFNLHKNGLALTGTAKQIQLPQPWGKISHVRLLCNKVEIASQQFSCEQGQIQFQHAKLGKQQLQFSLTASPEQKTYHIALTGLKLAGATSSLKLSWKNQRWQLQLTSPHTNLKLLQHWLKSVLSAQQVKQVALWQSDGRVAVNAKLAGQNTQLQQADIALAFTKLTMTDNSGNYATDSIDANVNLNATRHNNWQWTLAADIPAGQSYINPVFVDFDATPIKIKAKGEWQQQSQYLSITSADIKQNKVMQLAVSAELQAWQLKKLQFKLSDGDVNRLYHIWGQPFLVDTALAKLKTQGKINLTANWSKADYQLQAKLNKVSINDTDQRFGLSDLSGNIGWTNGQHSLSNDLNWKHGHIYAVPIGASQLKAQVSNSQLTLIQPLNVPILDGALRVNNLKLSQAGEGIPAWSFDGLLSPISMDELSKKLGWPLLHGKLSGVIPKVSYQQYQVKVDGALMVKLFGGTTVIRDLRLIKPFGALPQLYANIDMQGLDLDLITQTFDFGRITGKINGDVQNLRLSDWQPVYFDAEFATPVNDNSSHRISQRAVDNLSQIGGGASGVLSRSFLRFFKNFSYKRLGIKCKLRNDVCEMSGISEAKQGYYLVEGGGGLPPWIDVIGYTRRVDWKDLIARLAAVSNSSGPVIE